MAQKKPPPICRPFREERPKCGKRKPVERWSSSMG
jgi:hypothetical protein